jgi:O-antigen/teichoic acid export membrane protein
LSTPNIDPLSTLFKKQMGLISRQASVHFFGVVFTVATGYFFKIYVARVLGPDGLGMYALGMSAVDFLALFAALGSFDTAARYVGVFKADRAPGRIRLLFMSGIKAVFFVSVALAVLLMSTRGWVASSLLGAPGLAAYLLLFALLLPLGNLNGFLGGYLRGHQEVTRRTVVNAFVQFPVKIAATVVFFSLGLGLTGYVLGEIVGAVLAVGLLFKVAMRLTPTATARDSGRVSLPRREIFDFAGSMVGMALLGFLSAKLAEPLLGAYLGPADVGIYSVALATAAFVPVLLKSLNTIFGPVVSELHGKGKLEMVERLYQISTKWCLALTWPLVCVLVVHADDLMRIFGEDFARGGSALAVLAIGQMVNVAVGSSGQLLIMTGHQRMEVRIQFAAAGVSIVSLLLLVPRFGVFGAAIAFSLVLALSNLMRLLLVFSVLSISPYNRRYLRLLFPVLLSGGAVLALRTSLPVSFDTFWLEPLIGLLVGYGVLLGLAMGTALDADDRLVWNGVLSKLGLSKTGVDR